MIILRAIRIHTAFGKVFGCRVGDEQGRYKIEYKKPDKIKGKHSISRFLYALCGISSCRNINVDYLAHTPLRAKIERETEKRIKKKEKKKKEKKKRRK